MINWYKDNDTIINFSIIPDLSIRLITSELSKNEIKNINKKPFINKKDLEVELINKIKNKKYNFKINKNYTWDGATIPRIFWRIIGSKSNPRFLIASLIHDKLCENHNIVDNDRYFASRVFERLLYTSKINCFSRWLMFHSVDNFQKFCGW